MTVEDDGFTDLVYSLIQLIPEGKVTTYGHIAYLALKPNNSRQIGTILKHLSSNPDAPYNHLTVPWWRVIGASGQVSARPGKTHHIEKLRSEIPVSDSGSVSLSTYGWFPEFEQIDHPLYRD